MLWPSQLPMTGPEVMMPPPQIGTNAILNPQPPMGLMLAENLKSELINENSSSSLLGDSGMAGISSPTQCATEVGPMTQMVGHNSSNVMQANMMRANESSPVHDALLGVADLMRHPHPLTMNEGHQLPYSEMHENSSVRSFQFNPFVSRFVSVVDLLREFLVPVIFYSKYTQIFW